MRYKRYCVFISLYFLMAPTLWAQGVTVTGKTVTATNGAPVEVATIRLLRTDSTLVQGTQSDMDGDFFLQKVLSGRYILAVSSIGFIEHTQNLVVADKDIDLKQIKLREDVHALAEIDVKGHAAEMVVKGDTIEYNTSAYKVQDGAMVEELLKKMNGVEVDKEGNVQVNGEKITAVRIDGKKFFGNDIQSATKNIPADMIDKIQVIDQKSDMARLTGFDDDNSERIINLTLKSDRKKGVFGNYTAGLGLDIIPNIRYTGDNVRYTGNIFTNLLLDETQTTILGAANNINQIRSGRGRGGWSGSSNSGITRAENIGINTNADLTKKLKNPRPQASLLIGGDVTFNHGDNDNQSLSIKDSYAENLTYHQRDTSASRSQSWDTQLRLEVEWQIDSLNKLLIKPNLGYTNNSSNAYSAYSQERDSQLVSDGYQQRYSQSQDINASMEAIYTHKFLRPGRTLTFNAIIGGSDTRGNGNTFAWDALGDSVRVQQYQRSLSSNLNYSIKASYVEPIYGNKHFLEASLAFSGRERRSDKKQYQDSAMTVLDNVFSNSFTNSFFSETMELNYRWIEQNYDLMVGLRVNPSQTRSRTTYMDTGRLRDTLVSVWNFSPNVNFRYRFGKKEFARIIYRGTTSQPTINQMEPVRNNSNAMSETVGNLNLNPAFRHDIRIMYSKFDDQKFWSLMTGLRASMTKDALVNNAIYDQSGKLYQQTVNAKAMPWNISADLMFNTPLANKLLQLNTRTSLSYNQRISYIQREQQAAEIERLIAINQLMLGDPSRNATLEAQENLSLRITHDIVDFGVVGNVTYSRTNNNLNQARIHNVFTWSVRG